MVKSYKIILIIQFFVLAVFGLVFHKVQYGNDFAVISAVPLLLIGISPFLLLGISILLQRLIVGVIYSDSSNDNSEKDSEDKFWYNSFLANVIFAGVVFLASVVSVLLSFGIGINGNYDFVVRFSVFLGIIIIASLVIGLFLRIKDSAIEVSKPLGGLMVFLSVLIFGGSLFFGLQNFITLQYSSNDVIGGIKRVPEVDGTAISVDSTSGVETSDVETAAVDSVAAAYGEMQDSRVNDYYGVKEFSYPELEKEVGSKGIFSNYNWDGTEDLLRVFLSDFLRLKKGQSFMDIRRSIHLGSSSGQYSEIVRKSKMVRNNYQDLEATFENYSPLIYAFVSEKIYFDSNLNLLVDALIKSHDDINAVAVDTEIDSFDKIYGIMTSGTKKEFPGFYYDKLKPYVSKGTLELIKKNADENGESEYSTQLTTVWMYSFWARRNKERNLWITYTILEKIKAHYEEK
ncbi:hypothetical protein [Flavobacterium pectinovorum]|uniref:Uncharacterized protein n=1 Tax=Flavobacterium pectinovorum TaxID=29533 RepID=A0A502ENZ7_9FLAO|nr:hypothetical protein [Flavobacterium pectinovorum]TPG38739.1 hypothetical protein EAH81_14735 [Flavobacterium pectinovorum]